MAIPLIELRYLKNRLKVLQKGFDLPQNMYHIRSYSSTLWGGNFQTPKTKTSIRKIDILQSLTFELKKWKLTCPLNLSPTSREDSQLLLRTSGCPGYGSKADICSRSHVHLIPIVTRHNTQRVHAS